MLHGGDILSEKVDRLINYFAKNMKKTNLVSIYLPIQDFEDEQSMFKCMLNHHIIKF